MVFKVEVKGDEMTGHVACKKMRNPYNILVAEFHSGNPPCLTFVAAPRLSNREKELLYNIY
jgi:hypothetical protein